MTGYKYLAIASRDTLTESADRAPDRKQTFNHLALKHSLGATPNGSVVREHDRKTNMQYTLTK
jgi:hypothetical protein